MVSTNTSRNMEHVTINECHMTATEDSHPVRQDKSRPKASVSEQSAFLNNGNTEQSCIYKPLLSPKLRQRQKPTSMFNIRPSEEKEDIIEVQEICIETGGQQCVRERVTVLPELTSLPTLTQNELPAGTHTVNPTHTISTNQSEVIESRQRKVLSNGWIGEESKSPRILSCSTTPPVSPSTRRRSLGVLRTPAWGLRTYRDPNKTEFSASSPSSVRRRSLVLPRRHVPGESSPRFLRRKVLVSPDVTGLTTSKDSMNLSQSAEELNNSCDEQQSELQVENSEQSESQQDNTDQLKQTNSEEFEDFRPRLRSRSLGDSRTQARENALQNFLERPHNAPQKGRESRRKPFEVWLTDKEEETVRKLQMLALEKQRAIEEEAKRKEQRKGKTYEEWLDDKNNMPVVKNAGLSVKQEGTSKEEKQVIAKRRYEKWLMEKETRDLQKEREMLEKAKLKTIEMRRKYEEKKKKRLKFLMSSPF